MNELFNSVAAERALSRLKAIHEQASTLSSFRPGDGYDELGRELSGIVYADWLTDKDKETVMRLLPPKIKASLQKISIASEMELDYAVASAALAAAPSLPSKKSVDRNLTLSERRERFQNLVQGYPYAWSSPRARGERRLLETVRGQALNPDKTELVFFGRSMLPMSGLSAHFTTGAHLTWFDPFSRSAKMAQRFIEKCAELNIIEGDSVRIIHGVPDRETLHRLLDKNKEAVGFIIDKDYSLAPAIKAFHECGIQNIICSEVHGMAECLYPKVPRADFAGLYDLQGVIYAPHANTVEEDRAPVELRYQNDEHVFVSSIAFSAL